MYIGERRKEPWVFQTTNVRNMLAEALEIVNKTVGDSDGRAPGVYEPELLVAINHLRHAASELERSYIEMKFGVQLH